MARMTVYVVVKGGLQETYDPWLTCGRCGSYDLEEWASGRVKCRACNRSTYLVPVDPFVEELEDGGLAVNGPAGRLARYTKGIWISYRHADASAEPDAAPTS